MSNAVDESSPHSNKSPLARWIHRVMGGWGAYIKFRVRGNNLHVLCEGASCPDRKTVLLRLIPALQQTDLNTLISIDHPRLYQVLLYGRKPGQTAPDWTAQIHLNQLDRHLAQLQHPQTSPVKVGVSAVPAQPERQSPPTSLPSHTAIVLSNRSLAKRGQTEAIARFLSESLSKLGVAVQVSVKTVPYLGSSVTLPSESTTATDPSSTAKTRRLWITCESTYCPEPSLIGEPIARQLRELEIEGYRDAITLIQVQGETKPDWVLRVDLTPPKEMLHDWARWGDVQAIQRLLDLELAKISSKLLTISLKDSTLHLSCCAQDPWVVPAQQPVHDIIAPLLETLGPQGIQAATVYGHAAGETSPNWVEWLDLPASRHAALAESPRTLAKQRDWGAIAHLLNRLLNPDIDKQLATGGIRLQILPKQDLLHIMADAPICPEQRQVGLTVTRFLKELEISGIAGVRIYGRRAGQKRPLWSYGSDFASRQRIVPEATPEFAATDAYVGDLIAPSEEAILRPDLTPADLQTAWLSLQQSTLHQVQRLLIRSQLFTLGSEVQDLSATASSRSHQQGGKVALIWGAVGLLLMLQADWLLGHAVTLNPSSGQAASAAAPTPSATVSSYGLELSDISLQRSTQDDATIFNTSSFTQADDARPVANADNDPSSGVATNATLANSTSDSSDSSKMDSVRLTPVSKIPAASTPIATATAADSPYPTFNSRQMDEKIAIYYDYLEQSGPPDVMIIGSSRALRGVDPAVLRQALARLGYNDVTIFNFGVNGATAQVVNLILQDLLTPEQLPRLIIWADGARAFNSGGVDVTYNGIAASEGYRQIASGNISLHTVTTPATNPAGMPTDAAGGTDGIGARLTSTYQTLDRWLSNRVAAVSTAYKERDRLKALFQETVTTLFPIEDAASVAQSASNTAAQTGQSLLDFEGFWPLSVQFNPATYYQEYAKVAGEYDSDYENFRIEGSQAEALRSLLQFTESRAIPLVFVNLPMTQQYLDPARLKYEQEFKQYMVNQTVQHSGFIFRDWGELWLDQFDYFSDPSHLNRYGAYEISNRLAQDPMIPWTRSQTP